VEVLEASPRRVVGKGNDGGRVADVAEGEALAGRRWQMSTTRTITLIILVVLVMLEAWAGFSRG
jgi:hypothetical protein